MYKIKEKPVDFIVKEISNLPIFDSGKYVVCILKKSNYTTLRAVEHLARALGIRAKDIGFAGIKDKNAVTEQYISIRGLKKEDVEKLDLKDIKLKFVGYLDKPISLGDLEGNEFEIIVRNFKGEIREERRMPNFFGEQRFSKKNVEIGRMLLKQDFKEALSLIVSTDIDCKDEIKEYQKDKPNDFVGALKLIPKKLLLLYVHAYQSYLWNKTLEEYMKVSEKNIRIPIIGFGTEIEGEKVKKIIHSVMDEEGIGFRGFINKQIPEISVEGGYRDTFIEIKEFRIIKKGDDFTRVSFKLPKGSYATVAISFLFG